LTFDRFAANAVEIDRGRPRTWQPAIVQESHSGPAGNYWRREVTFQVDGSATGAVPERHGTRDNGDRYQLSRDWSVVFSYQSNGWPLVFTMMLFTSK
jgi:hypothetical protein